MGEGQGGGENEAVRFKLEKLEIQVGCLADSWPSALALVLRNCSARPSPEPQIGHGSKLGYMVTSLDADMVTRTNALVDAAHIPAHNRFHYAMLV